MKSSNPTFADVILTLLAGALMLGMVSAAGCSGPGVISGPATAPPCAQDAGVDGE